METIKETIGADSSQGVSSQLPALPTENYDNIELTPEESEAALREARKRKHFEIESKNYWDKVRQERTVQVPTPEQYRSHIIQMLGPGFKIDDDNNRIIELLLQWATADKEFESNGYSLDKGIMLIGPVGCGKTSIMKAISMNLNSPFIIRPCLKVTDSVRADGHDAIVANTIRIQADPYRNLGNASTGICYDDLGTEDLAKHFGNTTNVMSSIIQGRYVNETLRGKTHFTANLSGDEIEQCYGARIRSRLREMCNVLIFSPGAKDRRV